MITVARVILAVLAVAWFGLGVASVQTPILSGDAWLILCSMTAGSALAAMRWRTMNAVKAYTWFVIAVAGTRSIAYSTVGNWSPIFVWGIVVAATVGNYHLFTLYLAKDDRT